MEPIITSLLDTDLYKFTMLQVFLHRHPGAEAEYTFQCRNVPEIPLAEFKAEIEAQIEHLARLRFTPEELDFLRGLRFFKADFVDFLELFQLRRRHIQLTVAGEGLEIRVKAPLVHGMLFEIYVLAIVNEVYFRRLATPERLETGRQRLAAKIAKLKQFGSETAMATPFAFFDFGTRRRYSRDWHEEVVRTLAREVPEFLRGTSNVDMARRLGLTPIGTMAHEYLQAFQAFGPRLRDFQKAALEDWVGEYRGDLGIALTDVVGMDAFLRDFDLYFAKLFDGLRHDSGDPFEWGEKAISHYRALRIEPITKRLVFSDGLDIDLAIKLYRRFASRIQTGFGIGTHLTNDMGLEPLQIVMKLTRVNGQPVAKISDSPGKTLCRDETFLAYLRDVFAVRALAA